MMLLPLLVGCIFDPVTLPDKESDRGGVVLNLQGASLAVTRVDIQDNERESALDHIDVVIFSDASSKQNRLNIYNERFYTSSPEGSVRLGCDPKQLFVEGGKYWFYVIGNSELPAEGFSSDAVANLQELESLTQRDENIHLTGLGLQHSPSLFLMDGVAYRGNSEPIAPSSVVVINGSSDEEIVELNVRLRRAAAKFVVNIIPGSSIIFEDGIEDATPGYYLRNLPILSKVVDDYDDVVERVDDLMTTNEANTSLFNFITDAEGNVTSISVEGYVYSHSWTTNESFRYATNLLVDIPVTYLSEDGDGNPIRNTFPVNYYQIPLSRNFTFERNHYYQVQVHINAPGAEDISEPVVIDELNYSVFEWTERNIDVGGGATPEYLMVNREELNIFNTDIDSQSLYFSSSSPVDITVTECYYIDKYGRQVNISSSAYDVEGSTDSGSIQGNITVRSDVPTNNTIRYFTLLVTNQTGQQEYIYVKQHPLIYITNQLPWYSYRDDFYYRSGEGHTFTNCNSNRTSGDLPTTYIYQGDRISTIAVRSVSSDGKITYTYNRNAGSSRGFFSSKYRGSGSGSNYQSLFYYYTSSQVSSLSCESSTNVRNYHVRMTATSDQYILARPRLDENGVTDSGDDNSRLVSPSFVIASRLGAVYSTSGGLSNLDNDEKLAVFADHCKNYVEVDDVDDAKNRNNIIVYDNWRLPTKAEIEIIISLQGTENQDADAIDYLLNGSYYMSASGPVFNPKNSDGESESQASKSDVAIRCVRDEY